MKWTNEAEEMIKRVPFFVRKKVRARVEQEAMARGSQTVTICDVDAARKRFMEKMSGEVKGYQLDTCFSQGKCPNMANVSSPLAERIESILKQEDLRDFLVKSVGRDIKLHHELKVSISECPNACSQPQIKDIGIVGACVPQITDTPCTMCGKCVDTCKDSAITLDENSEAPVIDRSLCLSCGACAKACPSGTIAEGQKGYRVLLGGKLGRHPRLAKELPGLFDEDGVLEIVKRCIAFYKANSKNGARFAEIYTGPECIGMK